MATNAIAKKNKDETKYHMLRSQLDKMNFIQSIDYISLDLIEALLNEIISLKQKNKAIGSLIDDLQEKNDQQALMLVAFKHQNSDLFKQNGELHHEIISLLEKNSYQGKDIELKRLTDDTSTLKYLLNGSKEKTLQYQIELSNVKQKYLELIVGIYEKKINLSKIFEEITESDQLILKSRGIEMKPSIQEGSEVQSKKQNSSSNNTNSNHTNSNNNNNKYSITIRNNINNHRLGGEDHIVMGIKAGRSIQEMIEKIYRLETELKDRNNEITLLKKRISTENALDQQVVIDYLKNELKSTKEKYESYLKYQLDINNNNKHILRYNYIHTSSTQTKKKTQAATDRKEVITINSLQRDNNDLKGKYNMIMKENIILRDDIKSLLEKHEKGEEKRHSQSQYDQEDNYGNYNTNATTNYNNTHQRYINTDFNLISSLNEKVKESNARLSSSQQHFRNRLNKSETQNKELQSKIAELKRQIKTKTDLCDQQKEQINQLNKRVMQLSNETIRA